MFKNRVKKVIRLISLVGLGGLLFYPFLFCPFRVPYIYCLVCPVRCPWGFFRGFLLILVIILNVFRGNFFCRALCPVGAIQDLQNKAKTRKLRVSGSLSSFLRYLVLILVILVIFGFFRVSFFIVDRRILFTALAFIFIMSFFIYRFWCFVFCPFRTLSDTVSKIKKYPRYKSDERK